MSNALFAFDDAQAGQRAAARLVERGLPPAAVQLHAHEGGVHGTLKRQLDEQVTGGLVSNLLDLFQGIFEWGASPHDASAYEETVRRGGAVVSVETDTDDEREIVNATMLSSGCVQHTAWSSLPVS